VTISLDEGASLRDVKTQRATPIRAQHAATTKIEPASTATPPTGYSAYSNP